MVSIQSMISSILFLVVYFFVFIFSTEELRKKDKLLIYTIVFILLFFPDTEKIELPLGLVFNLHTYAIMVGGMELMELWTKYILGKRRTKGKPLCDRMEKLYKSL